MERLRQNDARRLFDFLRGLYALRDRRAFAQHVVSALPKLIPADRTAYDEMDTAAKAAVVSLWHPADDRLRESLMPSFNEHFNEHPLLAYVSGGRYRGAAKITDFATNRQFQSLGI